MFPCTEQESEPQWNKCREKRPHVSVGYQNIVENTVHWFTITTITLIQIHIYSLSNLGAATGLWDLKESSHRWRRHRGTSAHTNILPSCNMTWDNSNLLMLNLWQNANLKRTLNMTNCIKDLDKDRSKGLNSSRSDFPVRRKKSTVQNWWVSLLLLSSSLVPFRSSDKWLSETLSQLPQQTETEASTSCSSRGHTPTSRNVWHLTFHTALTTTAEKRATTRLQMLFHFHKKIACFSSYPILYLFFLFGVLEWNVPTFSFI